MTDTNKTEPNEKPVPGRDSPRLWLLTFVCFLAVGMCSLVGWLVSTYL